MRRVIPLLAAVALAGGVAGGTIEAALRSGAREARAAAVPAVSIAQTLASGLTPEQVYKHDAPGVVVITDTQTQRLPSTFFGGPARQQVQVLGSGFVIDSRGDIVTNDHVVQGATAVRVGFSGGATYPAKVIGTDPSTDLAVVRVAAPPAALHPLTLANSARVQIGDPVYAIGNPFGLDRTFTAGIVSATGRRIQAPNGLAIDHAIQTDAAINHGNSGGPLLDRLGRVIGVNAQIDTGGQVNGNVGVGFAIPSDTARTIVGQLLAHGHAQHAWLGVEVQTIDPTLTATVKGLPKQGVIVVRAVAGSPAARAGLAGGQRQVTVNGETAVLGGDVIVSFDGTPVASSSALADLVAAHKPGDRVQLGVVRQGQTRTVTVTLGNAPGGG